MQAKSDTSHAARSLLDHEILAQNGWGYQRLPKAISHSDPVEHASDRLNPAAARLSQFCAAEHMLRRKTPNGTLAAGYDGRSIEWAGGRPANKHFLVPASNAAGEAVFQPRAKVHSPYVEQLPPALTGEQPIEIPYDRYDAVRQNSETFNPANGMPKQAESEVNHLPDPGLDSVLYQGSPSHQLSCYPGGQQVPMVMQPMWPPCVGITSLNSPGPYGPYWPNGAFVPYRPAPIRDPRFDPGASRLILNGALQSSRSGFGCSSRGSYDTLTPSGAATSARSFHQSSMTHIPATEDSKTISSALPGPPLVLSPRDNALKTHGDIPLNAISFDEWHASPIIHDGRLPPGCLATASQASTHPYRHCSETNNIQFKEKVLIWAHRVYISLLSLRQYNRRTGLNVQYPNHRYPPENVFPQLPRQTFPKLSNAHNHTDTSREQHQSYYGLPAYGHGIASQEESIEKTKISSPPSVDNRSVDATSVSNERISSEGSQYTGSCNRLMPHNVNSKYRSKSVVFPRNQVQPEPSPAAAAVTAIEMLSRLCQESGWRWIDGMLLGGCLAYGLGDYSKALKWYSKVLSCDPNNVEASSNLAATLLSLERRQEAEDYWLRTVKLRPSYFEAVEHLVGMYCEDHRGKEAVELIDFVERSLQSSQAFPVPVHGVKIACAKETSPKFLNARLDDGISHIAWSEEQLPKRYLDSSVTLGSSGFSIPSSDNGRLLSLIHGKGNMLYALGDNARAAKAFEDVILIGSAQRHLGIQSLIGQILNVFSEQTAWDRKKSCDNSGAIDKPILLMPEIALETSKLVFPPYGNLPGLEDVPTNMAKRAGISIVSNSLLSLAKIYQDGMSSSGATATAPRATSGVQDILALYYLSLSLQPSPSTANNVGILLASVQQPAASRFNAYTRGSQAPAIPGVVPGSGIALALAYYNYGLNLDARHAHLYTNLGSLFKDIGQLSAAIKMYEKAVHCDGSFDIALANLANAVKDQGRISDAIDYYRRAVTANPDFAEAVCGLANALNSVCNWRGRGGVRTLGVNRDRWHVDEDGMLYDGFTAPRSGSGWIERVVGIVEKQLRDGEEWGKGVLQSVELDYVLGQFRHSYSSFPAKNQSLASLSSTMHEWANRPWEGAKVVRIVERATKRLGWQVYQDRYIHRRPNRSIDTTRPQLPGALAVPTAPTVLPFHTFTCPLSAKQIRKISQRNGLRISCSTLRAAWLPRQIYEPPAPPKPHLNIGYVSSDFNNHPLAHLMQSVFGFHNTRRVNAICYATTASDGSLHRQQIEREAPIFYDASSWSTDRLVNQIVDDEVHILVNLNGYTRGAKNEVFAARPAPVQMSFMGFAGTLGAEWCDYLLADKIAIPPQTLRPYRQNVDLIDQTFDGNNDDDDNQWVYGENVIFSRDTFFCCDHRQSAPDAREPQLSWEDEQRRRWTMRKELFPHLSDDTIILGNFNQLYKIEPTTFRTWLRILSRVPKAVLWLLRFPDLGETNLRETAMSWVGGEVASRVIFTDVAPKHQHIARARVCDLFLDTPECNAHTTAADVLWSGTPLLTFPRYEYKMCSRMAASILTGALPKTREGDRARNDLIVQSNEDYEERAVELGTDLVYPSHVQFAGMGRGRLIELRKLLYESRWTSALFDTRRWVRDLEEAYEVAWKRWVAGEGGDIWL
ncbi:MAG: hypothetical protein Q9225_001116 [Loekoesia sp. 1 TL-2023]